MSNQEEIFETGPTFPFEDASIVEQSVYETAYFHAKRAFELSFLRDSINDVISEREDWKYLASHDQLTGVLNRHGLNESLRQIGQTNNLGCLVVDGTNVKAINDIYGHIVGDRAIEGMANVLTKSIRDEDIIARVGGDEFVIFFSLDARDDQGTNPEEQLDSLKTRIKQSTEEFLLDNESFAVAGLEIAVGGSLPSIDITWEEMIQNAEEDMTEHKSEQHLRVGQYRATS